MKQFNDDNFVLETKTAQDLYHNHAAKMPIIDYHCHLIPEMERQFPQPLTTSLRHCWKVFPL